MRRRQFATLGVTGAALLAFPQNTRAQPPRKLPRIGWLSPGYSTGIPEEGFRQGVRQFGYIDGQNVIVDYRFGEGHYDRLAGLAAGLMQLRPDVLVAIGTAVTTVIKDATDKIPVVALLGDSVGEGFVASLARPGGNITGVSMMDGAGGLTGKRIELLKDALPAAIRIGMMFNPDKSVSVGSIEQAEGREAARPCAGSSAGSTRD
jgi:putative ABC transport system substrate-binding protein